MSREITPGPAHVHRFAQAAWALYGWPLLLVGACAGAIFVAGGMYQRFVSLEARVQSLQVTLAAVAHRVGVPPDAAAGQVPTSITEKR